MTHEKTPVWFVTGCSSGFGRALVERLVAQGHPVVASARDPATLDDLVAGHGDAALALPLDVTNGDAVARAVKEAEEKYGRIDVLVNNAVEGMSAVNL